MPSSSQWLNDRGCEYLAAIGEVQPTFLGELPVEEKDLPELFLRVRQVFDPDLSDAIRASTAVAAVHAAVHASEDHSSYIELFFQRLGTAIDLGAWNRSYGPAILRFLRDHFDEVDRPGGFRYVRPILNQAGISYRAMPAFAKFLGKLLDSSGMGFTRIEYESCLRSVTSSFARRFLVEGPGFDFTRDAARTLERIETGLIARDAIDTIPGYRHGFWSELLGHLEARPGRDGRAANRFPMPAEYLDTENQRLVLRFDEQGVARRAYSTEGRTVNFAVEPITNLHTISGALRQPDGSYQTWTCDPWLPGKSEWALFRATDGRLVCAQQADLPDGTDLITVTPGQYLLVAADELSVPSAIIVAEGSYLDSTDTRIGLYRIWSVQLDSGCEISELAVRATGTSVPSLSFAAGRKALRTIGSQTFTSALPKVIVAGWTEAAARNYTVLMDAGSGPICLDRMITDGVIQPKLPVPCQGCLWVEPRGRTRHGSASLSRLDFAVLTSPITWQIPKEPFDLSDEVPVRLEAREAVEVEWKSAAVPVLHRCWKIKAGVRVAEGTLFADNISLPFSIRIPRTAVFALGVSPDFSVLWADAIDKGPLLRVEALPGELATLQLQDEAGTWTLWDLGEMPASGLVECSKNTFRDYLLDANFSAARIGVRSRGRVNWSGVWIASARMIREKLSSAPANWTGYALPLVGPVLQILHRLESGRVETMELDPRVFQSPIAQFIADSIVSAHVLDHTKIICSIDPKLHVSPNLISMLASVSDASLYVGDGHQEVTDTPTFELIPIKRLRQHCENLWERSTWYTRLPEVVTEWRNEVIGAIGSPASRITSRPGGTELTDAARRYAQVVPKGSPAQFNALIARLSRCCKEDSDEICCTLRLALYQLALYHSGRRADAAEVRLGDVPGSLRRLQAQMQDLARLCCHSKLSKTWPLGIGFSDISPVETDARLEEYLLQQ